MAAEVEVALRSIAAAAAVVLRAGRLRSAEGEVASGRRTAGAGLVRMRAGPVRKWAGLRSRGRSLEVGRCEGERILDQQG